MPLDLVREQQRYQTEALARLKLTHGKKGRPAYPSYRQAWADTPWRTLVGGLLLLAFSVAWLAVL